MKIGYIYLYGEEWEEWKKNNKPLSEIMDELKEIGCDKIYMDVFIEDDIFPEIERIDMKELLESINGSSGEDDFELYLRGRVYKKPTFSNIKRQVNKEIERVEKRHQR